MDYEIYGEKALENNTGKFKNMRIKLTTIKGPKDIEIARLNKQLKKKELKLEILKKFDEMMRNLHQKKYFSININLLKNIKIYIKFMNCAKL